MGILKGKKPNQWERHWHSSSEAAPAVWAHLANKNDSTPNLFTLVKDRRPEADFSGSRCIIHRKGSTDEHHFCHLGAFSQVKLARSEVWTCLCQLQETLLSLLTCQGQQGLIILRYFWCTVTCKKAVILHFIVKIRMGELSPSLFILSSYFIYQFLFKYLHLFGLRGWSSVIYVLILTLSS